MFINKIKLVNYFNNICIMNKTLISYIDICCPVITYFLSGYNKYFDSKTNQDYYFNFRINLKRLFKETEIYISYSNNSNISNSQVNTESLTILRDDILFDIVYFEAFIIPTIDFEFEAETYSIFFDKVPFVIYNGVEYNINDEEIPHEVYCYWKAHKSDLYTLINRKHSLSLCSLSEALASLYVKASCECDENMTSISNITVLINSIEIEDSVSVLSEKNKNKLELIKNYLNA